MLLTFNSEALLLQPLTSHPDALRSALGRIEPSPQTRIDRGVLFAAAELASPRNVVRNQPAMIVLTDGRSNPVPAEVAVERAAEAKAAGITVFTIGLGGDLDFEALEQMASKPGFSYREQLAEIYAEIAGEIPCPAAAFWGGR